MRRDTYLDKWNTFSFAYLLTRETLIYALQDKFTHTEIMLKFLSECFGYLNAYKSKTPIRRRQVETLCTRLSQVGQIIKNYSGDQKENVQKCYEEAVSGCIKFESRNHWNHTWPTVRKLALVTGGAILASVMLWYASTRIGSIEPQPTEPPQLQDTGVKVAANDLTDYLF